MHNTLGVPIVIGQLSEGRDLFAGKQGDSVQQCIAAIRKHGLDDQVALAGMVDEPSYIPCKPVGHRPEVLLHKMKKHRIYFMLRQALSAEKVYLSKPFVCDLIGPLCIAYNLQHRQDKVYKQ